MYIRHSLYYSLSLFEICDEKVKALSLQEIFQALLPKIPTPTPNSHFVLLIPGFCFFSLAPNCYLPYTPCSYLIWLIWLIIPLHWNASPSGFLSVWFTSLTINSAWLLQSSANEKPSLLTFENYRCSFWLYI